MVVRERDEYANSTNKLEQTNIVATHIGDVKKSTDVRKVDMANNSSKDSLSKYQKSQLGVRGGKARPPVWTGVLALPMAVIITIGVFLILFYLIS